MEMNGHLHNPAAVRPGKDASLQIEYEARWARESVLTLGRRKELFLTSDENLTRVPSQ